MSHKTFGPDRFSRFDVYWIQTNKQTDRQAKFIYRYIYIFGPAVWQAKGNIYTNVLIYYLDWNILNHEAETNISTWMVPGWYQARSQEGAKGQGHPLSPKIGVQQRICTPSLFLNKLLGLFFFWKIWILLFKFFWNYYQSDAMYL